MKRLRTVLAVGVSALLHIALWQWAAQRASDASARRSTGPQLITFELRPKSRLAAPTATAFAEHKAPALALAARAPSSQRRRVKAVRRPVEQASRPAAPPAASVGAAGLRIAAGPRRLGDLQLFSVSEELSAPSVASQGEAVDNSEDGGAVGAALAQRRMHTWVASQKREANANHGIDEQLLLLGRVAAERLALQEEIFSDHVMWQDQKYRTLPLVGGAAKRPCFGACLVGPEVRGISVGIALEHDAAGRPTTASIALPSRRAAFDKGARLALEQAVETHPTALLTRRGPVRKTCWLLAAHVYHWSRESLLLDPQFTPPGIKLESESGLLKLATMGSSVWLTGVIDDAADSRCF